MAPGDANRTSIELARDEDDAASSQHSAIQPVAYQRDERDDPEDGTAICLSGGGARAMIFHLGALYRLNEAGILKDAKRISGVSGGSITAGSLGLGWHNLEWDGARATNLAEILRPIEDFAAKSVDVHSVLEGLIRPDQNAADRLEHAFDQHLYHGATLQNLPDDTSGPRFVFCSTNLSSSVLFRFSKPYARDWRVGEIKNPTFRVSQAVAASAAFPPFFAPLEIDVDPSMFTPNSGSKELGIPAFQRRLRLADGGVYDNLGLEPIFKRYRTIYCSDGGGQVADDPNPATDWIRETLRMTSVIDHQVRSLRKRLLIAAYDREDRKGAYWGIRQVIPVGGPLECPGDSTMALANLPTRLDGMTPQIRDRLINWGYAATDSALRLKKVPAPEPTFPRAGGVG